MADVAAVAVEEENDPLSLPADPPAMESHAVRRRETQLLRAQAVVRGRGIQVPDREVKEAAFHQAHENDHAHPDERQRQGEGKERFPGHGGEC